MNATKIFLLLFVGIAVGCVIWLGFFHDAHNFNRELSQEERRAKAVGAEPLPVQAIKIIIKNKPKECRVIDSAILDGETLTIYWHNVCQVLPEATTIHWDAMSPDGTLLNSGWHFTDQMPALGQRAEFVLEGHRKLSDPRIATIEVKARYNNLP